MSEPQIRKRVRKRSIAVQLQVALDDAAAAAKAGTDELSISRFKLLQTRIDALLTMQSRENRLALVTDELKTVKAGRVDDSATASRRIAELEHSVADLEGKLSTKEVKTVTVPDPKAAATAVERDLLLSLVAQLTATMTEQSRIEAAVRVSMSGSPSPSLAAAAAEMFCQLAKIDYRMLEGLMKAGEVDLIRFSGARDPAFAAMVKTIRTVKYPAAQTPVEVNPSPEAKTAKVILTPPAVC